MNLRIGHAKDADLAAIAQLAASSFADAYGWYNPPERIAAYVRNHMTAAAFRRECALPGHALLRADIDGETVGYAQIGPGKTPTEVASQTAFELKRFYVATPWHGKGIARPLMEAIWQWGRDQGYTAVWLGVWERNDRAIAFYQKCGFQQRGTVIFQFEDDPQTDALLVRQLNS